MFRTGGSPPSLSPSLDTRPQEAVQILHAAIGHDPYAEPLYQQAMRLHARLGEVPAIRDLRRALTRRLGEIDARAADVVKLRYFAGLTIAETANVLGISPRTADNDWAYARAWLVTALRDEG